MAMVQKIQASVLVDFGVNLGVGTIFYCPMWSKWSVIWWSSGARLSFWLLCTAGRVVASLWRSRFFSRWNFLDKSGFAIMDYLRSRLLNWSYGKVREKGTMDTQFNSGLVAFGLLPRGLDITPVDHQYVLTPFSIAPTLSFRFRIMVKCAWS